MSILIKNGTAVIGDELVKTDIYIEGSKIVKVGTDLTDPADEEINAEGMVVMPGLVDMHCHLREPGQEYKEDIESGTKAAMRGGFTSVACMPNTKPPIDNAAIVKSIVDRAAEVDNVKVYPIGCISMGQKGEKLAEMGKMKEAGIVAVSDDGVPVTDSNLMRLALEYADSHNLLVISHCEDKSLAAGGVVNEGFNSTVSGLKGITRVSEESMVAREILLAEALKTRVHIAHVSTKGSVELVRDAKARGVKVTAETCPHYFSATDDEILSYNTNAKINPPLREQSDVTAIIEGLKDGTIDAIATDHAPHAAEEKNQEFDLAPFGTSGFETAFGISYTHLVDAGHLDLPALCKLMSASPSRILGLEVCEIKAGSTADLIIADLDEDYEVDSAKFVSKGKNSVFHGWKVKGVIKGVIGDGSVKELRI